MKKILKNSFSVLIALILGMAATACWASEDCHQSATLYNELSYPITVIWEGSEGWVGFGKKDGPNATIVDANSSISIHYKAKTGKSWKFEDKYYLNGQLYLNAVNYIKRITSLSFGTSGRKYIEHTNTGCCAQLSGTRPTTGMYGNVSVTMTYGGRCNMDIWVTS